MKYLHRFKVAATLDEVRDFHQRASSMAAITPPPIVVVMHETPAVLGEGDEMEFTLWLGPLPLRWRARIENVTPTSFDDRQLRGPFKAWRHRHSFIELKDGGVEVLDEVSAHLSDRWFEKLIGASMWLGMPVLFTFRAWKTQRILHRPRQSKAARPARQDA